MDRRQALRSLGVAGSLGLAGCSSVLGSSGTVLGRIEVINASFTARTVRLAVERGDETLIDRQVSLGPADAADGSAWTKIQPTWSDTQSQYRIWALHLDEEGSEPPRPGSTRSRERTTTPTTRTRPRTRDVSVLS
ncbi:hypothetical protein ACFQL4_19595 [Halosimplex aquaticum]